MDDYDFTFESAKNELKRIIVNTKALDDLSQQIFKGNEENVFADFIESAATSIEESVLSLSNYIQHLYEGE